MLTEMPKPALKATSTVGLKYVDLPPQLVPGEAPEPPTPWQGACGGDARMRCLVPQLAKEMAKGGPSWGIVATHLPGRSGRECRDRWLGLCRSEQAFA